MKPDELLHRNAEFAVVGFVAADAFAAGDFKVRRPRIDLLTIVTLHDVALAAFAMSLPFALGR